VDPDGQGRAGGRAQVGGSATGAKLGGARSQPGKQLMADVVGTVQAQLPSGLYRVKLDAGQLVTAHIADRMDRNFIRVLVGERVRLELSPVDRGRGRIVERLA
jgi:translation initiation factor IF-1